MERCPIYGTCGFFIFRKLKRPAKGIGADLGRLGQALDRASSPAQREVASACHPGIEATWKAFPEH
ncbi:hypothetical protein [Ralstonia pseudosolanacearum]|uniref:hypothetical protein n=1 Tax=Ralstonia pseudosolanacearum TaxID=1310165 RepID=UPI001FFB841D|nr:hypothetical protein [Ralstonia pseudosolanacearum]